MPTLIAVAVATGGKEFLFFFFFSFCTALFLRLERSVFDALVWKATVHSEEGAALVGTFPSPPRTILFPWGLPFIWWGGACFCYPITNWPFQREISSPFLLFHLISFFFFSCGVQSTRGGTFSSQAPFAFYFEKVLNFRTGRASKPCPAAVFCDDLLPVERPNARILTSSPDGLASCAPSLSPSSPFHPFSFVATTSEKTEMWGRRIVVDLCHVLFVGVLGLGDHLTMKIECIMWSKRKKKVFMKFLFKRQVCRQCSFLPSLHSACWLVRSDF